MKCKDCLYFKEIYCNKYDVITISSMECAKSTSHNTEPIEKKNLTDLKERDFIESWLWQLIYGFNHYTVDEIKNTINDCKGDLRAAWEGSLIEKVSSKYVDIALEILNSINMKRIEVGELTRIRDKIINVYKMVRKIEWKE